MGDLISRKALLDVMPKRNNLSPEIGRRTAAAIRRIIANAPSVDAELVRHGEWGDLCNGKVRVCSYCKHNFDNTCNDIDGEWMFCPHCGTPMNMKSEEAQNNAEIES